MKWETIAIGALLICVGIALGFGYGRLNQIDRIVPALNCNFTAELPTEIKESLNKGLKLKQ